MERVRNLLGDPVLSQLDQAEKATNPKLSKQTRRSGPVWLLILIVVITSQKPTITDWGSS